MPYSEITLSLALTIDFVGLMPELEILMPELLLALDVDALRNSVGELCEFAARVSGDANT